MIQCIKSGKKAATLSYLITDELHVIEEFLRIDSHKLTYQD